MDRPNFLSILTGSFSTPASGNPTIAMVEAAYRHLGLQARYVNCDVRPEHLGDAVRGARAMGWAGFNCSLPHKLAVIEHLDAVANSAKLIGAVNCVVNRDGQLVGENTDGRGFLASLRGVADPKGLRVTLVGAGGAARAIAVELALAGVASITVVNRDKACGMSLVNLVAVETGVDAVFEPWADGYVVDADCQVLVNATSVGLTPAVDARIALDLASLRPGLVVADVIPNPPRTSLLHEAEIRGCVTLDGLGMLVSQAVAGIGLWTGLEPDPTVMLTALREAMGLD